MKIYELPDALSNKIAAGEVVERPASVVKELVENSIDAESTWIKVEVKEAGLESIKVVDNGRGMDEEDISKAFLRHATSKIKNEIDLFHVKTLGFRGEALASIASVSKLTIKSSEGNHAGTSLYIEGGTIKQTTKTDARQGTEIKVDELFYNTPARLKYMKTIHTELGHITETMYRLAMAHPDIRFEVVHNDKVLLQTTGDGDLLHVLAKIYGMSIVRKMLKIEAESLDFKLTGFVAKPEITRASRNYMSVIINGRYIKSIAINQAILRAYHTLLPIGRLPLTVLNIEMDPILIDVNVHPTKLEVRFSKEKELIELVEKTIRDVFRNTALIPSLESKEPVQDNPPKQSEQPSFELNRSDFVKVNETNTNPNIPEHVAYEEVEDSIEVADLAHIEKSEPAHDMNIHEHTADRIPPLYPIGQLQGTYIMAQNENGLYMIDQHAAQERIKYEYFKEKLGQTDKTLQELLIPITFEFTSREMDCIEQHKEELESVGIFFEHFGQKACIVRSQPTWFPKNQEAEIIREIVDTVLNEKAISIQKIREDAAILMSCKRSIKANHYLNLEDMNILLDDLRKTVDPFTCPHGRPIIVHFSTYELEKMFKRIM